MGLFRNMKLRSKLIMLNGASLLAFVILAIVSYTYLDKLSDNAIQMYKERLLPIHWLAEFKANLNDGETDLLQLTLTENEATNQKVMDHYNQLIEADDKLLSDYEQTHMDLTEKAIYMEFAESRKAYKTVRNQMIQLAVANKNKEAYAYYLGKVQPAGLAIDSQLNKLIDYNQQLAEGFKAQSEAAAQKAKSILILVAAAAALLNVALSAFINRLITKPIRQLQQNMQQASAGDLTADMNYPYRDEIGLLSGYYNSMLSGIRRLVAQVNDNAMTLAASSQQMSASAEQSSMAAKEVAISSQHLAEEFERQTEGTTQAAEALNRMDTGIQTIEAVGRDVTRLSLEALARSRAGTESVQLVSDQMSEISSVMQETQGIIDELDKRAEEIDTILTVMNEIANQTNLLALNAAIEAARAGEMGRGFSVVAEEVRKLATQSGESAATIGQLVRLTQAGVSRAVLSMKKGSGKVTEGIRITGETKLTFREIESSVSEVESRAVEVGRSIQELRSDSAQILSMMDSVNAVAHTGLSISEEAAAASQEQLATSQEIESASRSLAELAEGLQTSLSAFKTEA